MKVNTRGSYVSLDKRFRTTVFAKDQANINFILEKVLSVIKETFNPDLLSLTSIGCKRLSIHKRIEKLIMILTLQIIMKTLN